MTTLSWGAGAATAPAGGPGPATLRTSVERDGIAGVPGAFTADWADRLREDFEVAFERARSIDRGTVGRGPDRHYFAVPPQWIRGFLDLVTHPAVRDLATDVLGEDHKIVELGFDVPLPGAVDQPWHRDFPLPGPPDGPLTSLAWNVTTVDVGPDMGPFEIAPGTHRDDGATWDHGMFPPVADYPRYQALASRRMTRRGDMSVRTGLTVHHGTANTSDRMRAVLILGAATRDTPTDVHGLPVTRDWWEALPADLRRTLDCTIVERLGPIRQRHDIEGLHMGGPL